MPKIAIGGFQHETNTFAPHLAHYEEFVKADGWPALTQGEDLFPVMSGLNIPLAGFIDAARQSGHQLHPVLWCSAEPSSFVTSDAYERIVDEYCDLLKAADHLDAVYLDLHGAMVVEHFEAHREEYRIPARIQIRQIVALASRRLLALGTLDGDLVQGAGGRRASLFLSHDEGSTWTVLQPFAEDWSDVPEKVEVLQEDPLTLLTIYSPRPAVLRITGISGASYFPL